MDRLSVEERIRLVELYYENGRSPKATLRAYGRQYGDYQICSRQSLHELIQKFRAGGSVADAKRPGRPGIDDDTICEIAHVAQEIASQNFYGEASTSAISNETRIPKSTVLKAMRKQLKLRPYRIQRLHELKVGDPQRRLAFAERLLAEDYADPQRRYRIMYSDEANFTLCGQVNTWNTRIWSDENPHTIIEQPLHAEKVTVWVGFTAEFLIGPYFFREVGDNGQVRSVTVNSARYLEMLDHYVEELAEMEVLPDITFQQDGAPAHTTRAVINFLNHPRNFNGRLISRNSEFEWPARSPDLTPCDFWLWPYLKSHVYKTPPRTMNELIRNISAAVRSITPEQLRKTCDHVIVRLNKVVEHRGGHIEQFL